MANTRSALKRNRQNEGRTARNKAISSRLKTARKAVRAAVEAGNAEAAAERFRTAVSYADKAAKSKIIHRNAAQRIKSQLSALIAPKKPA